MSEITDFTLVLEVSLLDNSGFEFQRKKISSLVRLLGEFIHKHQSNPEFNVIRRNCAYLSINLSKILSREYNPNDKDYSVQSLNAKIFEIIDLCNSLTSNADIQIKDPTNTKIGRMLASHTTIQLKEFESSSDPWKMFVARGGCVNTLYNDVIHVPDLQLARKVYQANVSEVCSFLKVGSNNFEDCQNKFVAYLLLNVSSFLSGTLVKYSEDMTRQQNINEFMWFR